MKINQGKKFENNFKASIPSNCWFYRLRDGTANWTGGFNNNVRFQQNNIADCIVFNGNKLYICELKAHAGKSIPLSCIRQNQAEMMLKANVYHNINCLLFVFFYEINKCYALNIDDFDDYVKKNTRKSIPIAYFEEKAIEIPVRMLKTNHRFALLEFFS